MSRNFGKGLKPFSKFFICLFTNCQNLTCYFTVQRLFESEESKKENPHVNNSALLKPNHNNEWTIDDDEEEEYHHMAYTKPNAA